MYDQRLEKVNPNRSKLQSAPPAGHGPRGLLAVCLCLILALLLVAGCDERNARERLDGALAASEDTPLPRLERELQEIVDTWPDTDAAARARRELQWIRDLQSAHKRGRWLAAADAARRVASAAERYRLDRGAYPNDVSDLVPRYLDRPVHDPWGGEVLYRRSGRGYTVVSLGADGVPGGIGPERDVIVESGELRAGTEP
jgi:general secretion pathway protein G